MKRYSPECKSAVLAKLLPPYNMTVTVLAQQEGISEVTLYNWRLQDKLEGKPEPGAKKPPTSGRQKRTLRSSLKPPHSVKPN